jgi:HK97 family phage prohead protease
MKRKYMSAPVVLDPALNERQIMVVASDPTLDRTKDVMNPAGCVLDHYLENPIVLASHDPTQPIGTSKPVIRNGRVEALIDFAQPGISAKADEWCALAKSGVIRAVSVGFDPIEFKPNKAGGYDYDKWELMELSLVAIPANPGARIIARAHDPETKDAPVLNAKGMYGIACLASILDDLGYLQSMTAFEAEMEGDGSNLPVTLGEAMRSLANALIAMSREEAAELLAGAGAIPDVVAADNAASKPLSFIKTFAELHAKAGRALSATNTAHVAEIGKALDAIAGHHAAASEHVKALSGAGKKPQDEEDDLEADDDNELSFAVAQRKRLAAVAAIRRA